MGDSIAVLPTDKIPSTVAEKEALILLYGEDSLPLSKPQIPLPSPPPPPPPSLPSPPLSPSSHGTTPSNGYHQYQTEMSSLLMLVVMFAIWTFPPFTSYLQTCFPSFKTLWVLFWLLQIAFFAVFSFFVLNRHFVSTDPSAR
jgi:hypothetical protein